MLHLKPFRQSLGYCGPASLKMVLAYFGVRKSEQGLAELSGCARAKGVEGQGLLKAAKLLGFEGLIKNHGELSDLRKYLQKKKLPVIVDWFSGDEGHYSVVVGINRKRIFLQDPELGRLRSMPVETFFRVWFDFPGDYLKSERSVILRQFIVIWPPKGKNAKIKT